jgi:hypothetical protein
MAIRLRKNVVKGEIDNRVQGRVTGKIWLHGKDDPIELSLQGNCLRDIAGCRLTFRNPTPEPDESADIINTVQRGPVGDMTASRKVKLLDVPVERAYEMKKAGEDVPTRIGNCVYLEWFSEMNGRVVIETADLRVRVSPPAWTMTLTDEVAQRESNDQAISDWMNRLSDAMADSGGYDPIAEEPMDEFEWEKELKRSDALTDKYSELFEKYIDHPDREKILAREMGWTWLDDALDADELGIFDDRTNDVQDAPTFNPNPLTEGKDWVLNKHGHVVHPLANRAFETAITMWKLCKDAGLMEDSGDKSVHDMVFHSQTLSAKLAGALNSLAYEHQPDAGFVVACLKRSLRYFDNAMASLIEAESRDLVNPHDLKLFRTHMFAIRQSILELMKEHRNRI